MVNKFPKINFFAYVINYDVFGKSQGSAAIADLGIGIKFSTLMAYSVKRLLKSE